MKAVERLINYTLSFDPNARQSLKTLTGGILKISITPETEKPPQDFWIEFTQTGIIFSNTSLEPTLLVTGPFQAFLNLALNKDPHSAAKLGLNFSGDVHSLTTLQALFFSLEIDCEEMLSHWTGEILAHHIGNFIRFSQNKKAKILKSTAYSLSEYLKEESLLLPTRSEVNQFMEDVDTTSADVERLYARIERLIAKKAEYDYA